MNRYKTWEFWSERADELGMFALKVLFLYLGFSFAFSVFIEIFIQAAPRMCEFIN